VQAAVADGAILERRMQSYRKLLQPGGFKD
jgi:hypothetical protein